VAAAQTRPREHTRFLLRGEGRLEPLEPEFLGTSTPRHPRAQIRHDRLRSSARKQPTDNLSRGYLPIVAVPLPSGQAGCWYRSRALGHIQLESSWWSTIHAESTRTVSCLQPSQRLINKESLPEEDGRPARIRRRYSAYTPWYRICQAGVLPPDRQQLLQARIHAANPRVLSTKIDALCDQLHRLPVKSGETPESVYATLAKP